MSELPEVRRINFRDDIEGGDVNAQRARDTAWDLQGKSHLIFLIHGYNNTQAEAKRAYDAFLALHSNAVNKGVDWTFGATVVEVFWPGDAHWGLFKPAVYPWALSVADRCAKILCDIVIEIRGDRSAPLVLDFVSHSMGNRLMVAMLAQLRNAERIEIRRSIHMAAALPVNRLENPKDDLYWGLVRETWTGKATSHYSACDWVLAWAFPAGETGKLVSEGFAPVALGHQHWLPGDSRPRFLQIDDAPAGHGDYWPSKKVQDEVREELELEVTSARSTATRETAVAAAPELYETAHRGTATRDAGDSLFQ